jgi:heptosyltransferase-2
MEDIKKILIIQTAFIGDIILTTPMVRVLYEEFHQPEIHFLTIPSSQNILETNPFIRKLIIYDKKGEQKGISAFLNLANQLKEEKYDAAIIPHRSIRSALLARLADIPIRIGFNKGSGKWFHTNRMDYQSDIHEYLRNLHLLSFFEIIPSYVVYPDIFPDDVDKEIVTDWLFSNEILETDRIITMAPGSVWATKRWLPERFAELGDQLARFGYSVVLIGGQDDYDLCEFIVNKSEENLVNAAGVFTLRQSAEIIGRSEVLITNDSAPLHMGVAMRTPVIAIFGATVPKFGFYPYGPYDKIIEIPDLYCRPCGIHGKKQCPERHFRCMRDLSVHQVFQAAVELLKSTRS